MKGHLDPNISFLKLLCSASSPQRRQLVRIANDNQIQSVCECAHNLLRRNVSLSPRQIAELRKHKTLVYKLADKSIPVAKKRRVLEQSGGGIAAILIPVISAIASLFAK